MPREYKTTTGKGSPSPASFGAADINLTTPRFVAQTNVAAPENKFDVLQKILGIGASIGSQFLQMQTEKIQSSINYDRAVEARNRQKEADTDRERQKEAQKFSAEIRLEMSRTTNPAELKQLEERLRKLPPPETPEMQAAVASATEAAEAEQRQMVAAENAEKSAEERVFLDKARSFTVTQQNRIQTAYEAGNSDQLMALRVEYAERLETETNLQMRQALTTLRSTADAEMEKLNNRMEAENTKMENATKQEALTTWSMAAAPHVDALKPGLPELEKQLEGVSDVNVRRALVDRVRDSVVESNPELGAAMANASEAENDAASLALERSVNTLVDGIISIRNARNQAETFRVKKNDYVTRTVEDNNVFDEISMDTDITDPQRRIVQRDAAFAVIQNAETDVAALSIAMDLMKRNEPAITAAASTASNDILQRRASYFALERQKIIQTHPSEGDLDAAGWNTTFNTKDEFLAHVLGTMGTSREAFDTDLQVQTVLGPLVEKLGSQYDQDTEKTRIVLEREEKAANAADAKMRRMMKTEDAWKMSPLYQALKDGSYVDMSQAELYGVMYSSLVGFADVSVPTELGKIVIDGAADPKNFNAVLQFWSIMNKSVDPTARNAMLTDDKFAQSFAIATVLKFLDGNPEMPKEALESIVVDFAANLKAYKEPEKTTPEGIAKRKSMNQAVLSLSEGDGIDTSWWGDYSGVEPKEVMGKMSSTDRSIMYQFATLAANYPEAGDRGAIMTQLMGSAGYRIYSLPTQGNVGFTLINNTPGRLGTTPFPPPSEMETAQWRDYLKSKKAAIAADLSSRRQLDNTGTPIVFDPDKLGAVEPTAYSQDLLDGYSTVRVNESGRWINISSVRLTREDFEQFKKTWKPKEVTMPPSSGIPYF